MQGRPVGQYSPPQEIQPKAKQQKKRVEMAVPETQLVASGQLASASESESAQLAAGGMRAQQSTVTIARSGNAMLIRQLTRQLITNGILNAALFCVMCKTAWVFVILAATAMCYHHDIAGYSIR